MNPFIIFLIELFIVFLSSRYIFKFLFLFFLVLTKSQKVAIVCLSVIFFIGVVIHELSHMFTAEVLSVKTHGIEMIPELQNGKLKMGSVSVSKTDFVRAFLIGIAPLIIGCSIVISSLWFIQKTFTLHSVFSSFPAILITIFIMYLLFVIANTMFSSKKDMEGAVELLIIFVVFEVGAFFVHVPVNQFIISLASNSNFEKVMQEIDFLFAIPVGINLVSVLLFFSFFKKMRLA